MPNDVKVIKKADITNDLREAVAQSLGQTNRATALFLEEILDIRERLEKLEKSFTISEQDGLTLSRHSNRNSIVA